MDSLATIIDEYGNNVIVECADCTLPFLISKMLNSRASRGRHCPHCGSCKAAFIEGKPYVLASSTKTQEPLSAQRIIAKVKPLAAEFYRLTGKPLGVTGELAEFAAAEILGLELTVARTEGYDALRGLERIQIKGRAYGDKAKPGQRISKIKLGAPCDTVLLVILSNVDLAPREIWEAPYNAVCEQLQRPGSKSRDRGALSVTEFKRAAIKVWPTITHDDRLDSAVQLS